MTRRARTEVDAQHQTERTHRRGDAPLVDQGSATRALHYTAGADTPLPDWQLDYAARYVYRHARDAALILDALGLAAPVTVDPDEPIGPKQCLACHAVKPTTEFHRDRQRPDGLHPYCKPCKRVMVNDANRRRRKGAA